jgi:hypothetical protein
MTANPKRRPGQKREVAYGKTALGQALWDVCFSRLSAAECVRRHPDTTREFVLALRRKYPQFRPKRWPKGTK